MSQFPTTNETFATQPPPSHHIHDSSDVLPGARGAAQAAPDYSADVTNDSGVWQDRNQREFGAGTDTGAVMAGGQHSTSPESFGDTQGGRTAFNEDRPMGVEPTERGGVAVGGDPNLPEGKAKLADKIIGKTQKVAGKVMSKPAMHEKGELREAGGKAAAQGQARAPHD
ncbi:uncharacterized protein TRAVEDRAFT_128527 [Trametes versicolor FP-101664 SS1]|uniref:uncharacterized protein n=1 Tax=Trametes versicolor (strain FP-101664) TaxID=717944 RepID=UPI000462448F|nr:uncharacterized protein TRAVEDRAFT_128527 [Trametes versicolor FP-101664 SS1]EIW56831.1 hypothetical protein TRAVEDRAFT_128527 [Trametes versicolor FP-101664 SS1]